MKRLLLAALAVFGAAALTLFAEADRRLTVHTLVREDIFAGFMANDMTRFAKGEAALEELAKERPDQLVHVRAWQGSAALYRAAVAFESGNAAEGDRQYSIAQARYAEAEKLGPNDGGVLAVEGATFAFFADRLPADKRAAAWAKAYDFYKIMASQQMPVITQLPVHLKGELLAGLTMSAQRTGHQEEFAKSLDKMIEVMADTPYGRSAIAWKERPEIVAKTSLMCKNCHDGGRLEARKTALAATAK